MSETFTMHWHFNDSIIQQKGYDTSISMLPIYHAHAQQNRTTILPHRGTTKTFQWNRKNWDKNHKLKQNSTV